MTPYKYVISETLLQRTKAETVAKFYPIFIQKFPNWESIHYIQSEELEDFLRPIGLHRQRAQRLKRLAEEIILFNGNFPEKREELEKFSFLGQYIVNAILLFIHYKRTPLLDVNMARVLERIFGKRRLADIRYDIYLQKLAYQFVKHERSIDLNWSILDFASLICKPKPMCEDCILISICKYNKS